MRPVPDCTYAFIKTHEGLRLDAYQDVAGVVTVGWGHVALGMKPGQTIPESLAELYLKGDVDTAAKSVCARLNEPVLTDLTDNQYAALIDFVFNLGPRPRAPLWKLINARDHAHVPAELMRWTYAGGNKVQGLVNRRADEVKLWSTAEPGSVPDEPSSAATRVEPTPALPAKSPFNLGHLIAGAIAALGGLAQGAKSVADTLSPYAEKSEFLQHAVAYAMTAGGIAAVVLAGLMWLKSKEAKS